jgi:hypothetical protein
VSSPLFPVSGDPRPRETALHDLKTWPVYFEPLLDGRKTFELRKNDRGFAVGDTLRLREFDMTTGYSGREVWRRVTYVLDDEIWMMPGHVVLGLAALAASPAPGTADELVTRNPAQDMRDAGLLLAPSRAAPGTGTPPLAGEQIALVEDIIAQVGHDQSRRAEVNNVRADALRAVLAAALAAPAGTGTCGECRHWKEVPQERHEAYPDMRCFNPQAIAYRRRTCNLDGCRLGFSPRTETR